MSNIDMLKRASALRSVQRALELLNGMSDSGTDTLDCFAILDLENVIRDLSRAVTNAEIEQAEVDS